MVTVRDMTNLKTPGKETTFTVSLDDKRLLWNELRMGLWREFKKMWKERNG